jgi:hypothetical protein
MPKPVVPNGKREALTWGVGAVWLGIVLTGTFLMVAYANTPGETGAAPVHWPETSGLTHNPERPTLVMFIHPHCPCSRASVGELALLMAHCQGRVEAHVFFVRPAGMTTEWVQTDTWREASRIPGVTVYCDDGEREARRFGAETSGVTELFDAQGRLLFHGGITAARGHSGDNDGRDAVQALIFNELAAQTNTPVFGCSLFNCEAKGSP